MVYAYTQDVPIDEAGYRVGRAVTRFAAGLLLEE